MSYVHIKALLATAFLAAALTAVFSILTLLGRTDRRVRPAVLMATHRAAGYVAVGLIAVLAVFGVMFLRAGGDGLPVRGVLHWTLGALLMAVVALKLLIVRAYRQFLKFVPVMGFIIISIAFLVLALSLGFLAATGGMSGRSAAATTATDATAVRTLVDDLEAAARGGAVFEESCGMCHSHDSDIHKIGPSLRGLTARASLSSSGLPPTRENMRGQILSPAGTMPSFESRLSDRELSDLIAYLESL